MTLTQLRAFAAVASAGSVGAAARRLHVTQPAVSAAVRALEADLGVALTEPDGRSVRLTDAGATFAAYAHRVLGLLDEAALATRGEVDPEKGTLRIAAVTTASEHVLPRALASFRLSHPDVNVILEVGNKDEVWELMLRHTVDVVLAGRPPTDDPETLVRARRDNHHVIIAAPGIVTTSTSPCPLADLQGYTWLLRETGSGTRATMEALLAANEVEPDLLVLGSAVVEGAVAGLGLTLVSRDAVTRELAAGDLVVIETTATPLQRPWHVVTHAQIAPTARLFVEHLVTDGPGNWPRFDAAQA